MGHGIEPCKENSGHARDDSSCMEMVGYKRLGSHEIQYPKCKPGRNWELGQSHMRESDDSHVESSMMSYSGSELGCRGNSSSELKSMCSVKRPRGNGGKQSHVCRYCSKVFSSGRALGGHMRVHGANGSKGGQASLLRMNSSFSLDQMGDYYSSTVKKSEVPTSRSSGNTNTNTNHVEDEEGEDDYEGPDEHDMNIDQHNTSMDGGQELSNGSVHRMAALYTLRRNPKRSSRLTDQEFSMEFTANNCFNSSRFCYQCRKEFSSSKALFGHMRCHPEREWRGIQPPNDDTNTDPNITNDITTAVEANNNGALVVAASSDLFWQSSPESEDLVYPEVRREEDQASENESDAESMKAVKAAAHQQQPSCSFLNWSVTAKRGRRRPLGTTQTKAEDGNDVEEEEPEVNTNKKELEEDRDTAYFLFMLASSTSNNKASNNDTTTNNKASQKADEHVGRQMTEESVDDSKTQQSVKRASEGSNVKLEAGGEEDLDWKGKSIKESKKRKLDKTSRPAEAGEPGSFLGRKQELMTGKYKCCTCKKLFNSHQALGGHRASHKKVKGCYAMTTVNDDGQDVIEEEITEEGTLLRIEYPITTDDRRSLPAREETRANLSRLIQEVCPELVTVSKKVKGHECSICHKIFPSGQALGGHKRCHWTGDRVTETASSVISTEKQPKAPARNVRELPFDLNEPPPVEEEDLEVVHACAGSVDKIVKMPGPVISTGFTHVRCNICGCLFTSMKCLRSHQIEHALMPAS